MLICDSYPYAIPASTGGDLCQKQDAAANRIEIHHLINTGNRFDVMEQMATKNGVDDDDDDASTNDVPQGILDMFTCFCSAFQQMRIEDALVSTKTNHTEQNGQ